MNPTYHPTHQDILCTRPQNHQIDEHRLKIGPSDYLLIDPVGVKYWNDAAYLQKRLLHYFELTLAVAFVIDLSSYDRPSSTSASTTELEVALRNYDTLINCPWMRSKGIILLFVEWDAFAQKLATSPLKHHFPDFEGGDDAHEALGHIRERFLEFDEKRTHRMYIHVCDKESGTPLHFIVDKTQQIAMKESLRSNSRTLPK